MSFGFVEKPQQPHGVGVVDTDDVVGGAQIVDPGHMAVADTFDAVFTESVVPHGRTLQGLHSGDFDTGIDLFQIVGTADGSGGTGGKADSGKAVPFSGDHLKRFSGGSSRHMIVPKMVAHFVKLVEDHGIFAVALQIVDTVKDRLDVGFSPLQTQGFTDNA